MNLVMKQSKAAEAVAQRRLMAGAIVTFLTIVVSVIVLNSTWMGHGFHLEYSISRYMGLETWSAVLFGVGSVLALILMLYYLYEMGESLKMPRVYFWLVILMAVGLVGLLACPVGYFDLPGTAYGSSAPSRIHEICSRMMFMAMLLAEVMVATIGLADRRTRVMSAAFVMYGLLCIFGYFSKGAWFLNALLLFEGMYLLGFMVVCLVSRRKALEENE